MLDKLKKFFEENDIVFTVRGNDLVVPCPADCVPLSKYDSMTMDEMIEDDEVSVWTDEALIHFTYDEEYNSFSLMIELPMGEDDEEE